jgi:uncharacterized protein (TIGR00255 family)
MTGFGTAQRDEFKVDIRSLNHRHSDISVRMPSQLLEHEIPIRNLIKERLARGKIDVTVSLTGKGHFRVTINKGLAREIYGAFSDLQRELSLQGPLTIDFISAFKEVVLTEEPEYRAEALLDAVNDALSGLEAMRRNEGEALKRELISRIENLERLRREIEELSKGGVDAYRESLSKRIEELLPGSPVDEMRLAQEIVLVAQKMDITEELARLKSHLRQFRSVLSEGDVVGRRLDFLLQEMNREANTIASKSGDVRIVNGTIDLKTELEKLREQVQNIQ